MTGSFLKTLALGIVALTFSSCLHAEPLDQEEMLGLSAALTKVSASVHTAVRYKNPAPDLRDGELLSFATAHNPSLLNAFDGYLLKARQDGTNSSVLVCDAHGEVALIEDAGCTSSSDQHIWEAHPDHACAYVLNLSATCPVN